MFDELKPDQVPAPPANALGEAMRRGTTIRRRRRTAWASGVAAAVVLGFAVILGSPFSGSDSAMVVPAAPTTAPRDYSPIPEEPSEERDGVRFGFLEKISTAEDGTLSLRIQPGAFYLGQEAADHNNGEWPPNDYLAEEDEGTPPTDYVLDPKATLLGYYTLLGNPPEVPEQHEPITAADLVKYGDSTQNSRILVWFRVAEDGPITALSEQFTP